MISSAKKQAPPPKIQTVSLTGWSKGVNSRLDADRTPTDAIFTGENVALYQNGTLRPRPSLKLYGTQPANPVLGQIFEFVKLSGSTPQTYLICMQNVAGTGTLFYNMDGGAWTPITGKTYSSTAKAHFEQVNNKILVMNSSDSLSYVDLATMTITPYNALTTPTISSITGTGITGTKFTGFWKVTAINQGETAGSATFTIQFNISRDSWDGTTTFAQIVFPRITGADRYAIYYGDTSTDLFYFDTVTDPGTGANVTYTDIGSPVNVNRRAPVSDSTAGPKVGKGKNVRGGIYLVQDADNPGRIWYGGSSATTSLKFDFSSGGGFVEPNPGGKDFPVDAEPFRDGKGTPLVAVLSKGTNGAGKRYLLQRASTSLGDFSFDYMDVQEDNGQDGTDSPDGVVLTNDGLWYPSRQAFKTSNNKANIPNLISTSGISDNINQDVAALSSQYMGSCVGLAYDQKIYWALPFQSQTNNQIWVLDLTNNGAWMRPWYVNADWMMLYASNGDGKTHFLILSNNKIYEFDYGQTTNDDGVAFPTNISSGNNKFSDDGIIWAKIIDVTFVFLRPQGSINLTVTANTEDGVQTFSDVINASATEAVSARGRYRWGGSRWGGLSNNRPLVVNAKPSRRTKKIEVDENCNWFNWSLGTAGSGNDYQLSEVIARYVSIGYLDTDSDG